MSISPSLWAGGGPVVNGMENCYCAGCRSDKVTVRRDSLTVKCKRTKVQQSRVSQVCLT